MAVRILQDADGNSTVIKLRSKQQPVEVPLPSTLLTKKRLKKLDEKLNKLQKEFGLEKATALVGAGASAASLAREQGRTTHSAQAAWHRQQASECQTAGCQADDDGDETGADNNFRAAGRHMQAASMHDQAAATRTPTAVRNAWNQSARAQMSAPVGAPPAEGGPKGDQSGKRVVMTPEDEKTSGEDERSTQYGEVANKAWSDEARQAAAESRGVAKEHKDMMGYHSKQAAKAEKEGDKKSARLHNAAADAHRAAMDANNARAAVPNYGNIRDSEKLSDRAQQASGRAGVSWGTGQ